MTHRPLCWSGVACFLWVAFGCAADRDETLPEGSVAGVGNEAGAGAGAQGGAPTAQGGAPTVSCAEPDDTVTHAARTELFGLDHVPIFDLILSEEDRATLEATAIDEVYVPAQVCFDGVLVGQVGVRYKGSYGSLYGCFDGNGERTCDKLSLKLKFDEYQPELRFFGQKRLNFNAAIWDLTYLRERLGYDTFRAMGIEAPYAAWATLRMNGESLGLFGMVEQIDGRFTADRWPDHPDGNLYKEAWPGSTLGQWVNERLKTNEELADTASFVAFSEAMAEPYSSDLRQTLAQHMDEEALGRYMAVDDAIANWDGVTAVYVSELEDWSGNHNFYLYEDTAGHFTLIPWDLDAAMTFSSGYGVVPRWTELPEDCGAHYPVWTGESQVLAPGCNNLFRALASDLSDYRAAAEELLDGPFAEKHLLAAIDRHAALIRSAAAQDPFGPGESGFTGAIAAMKAEIPLLRERLEFFLDGGVITPLAINPFALNDFEHLDTFGIRLSTLLLTNPNSSAAASPNRDEPLSGEQDLRLDFEYGNEAEPWGQWSFFRVMLSTGALDVREFEGIRMKVRSDTARRLRFEVESPLYSAPEEGIRFGWDAPVTPEPTTIEVRFTEATIPTWARDPGDVLDAILAHTTGLTFHPLCEGAETTGQLPEGTSDVGFVSIDDLLFF